MLLCVAACVAACAEEDGVPSAVESASGTQPKHKDAGPPRPDTSAADSGNVDIANSSPIPTPDAGTTCAAGGSLADYCDRELCPQVFELVKMSVCAAPTSPHRIAKNSCSGMSAIQYDDDGDTRYDYGEEGELLGVTMLGGPKTCSGSDVTYGRACTLSDVPERFCHLACSFIACAAGLTIYTDAKTPQDYQSASVEFCRNDLCSSGTFNAKIEAVSGSKEIVYSGHLSDNSTITFMLGLDRPTPWQFVYFEGPAETLQHGDHYKIEVTNPDGHVLYELDQTIERYDISQVNAPCTQYCKVKGLDTRSASPDSSDLDAGSP